MDFVPLNTKAARPKLADDPTDATFYSTCYFRGNLRTFDGPQPSSERWAAATTTAPYTFGDRCMACGDADAAGGARPSAQVRARATRAGGATSAAAVLSTARRRMLQLRRLQGSSLNYGR